MGESEYKLMEKESLPCLQNGTKDKMKNNETPREFKTQKVFTFMLCFLFFISLFTLVLVWKGYSVVNAATTADVIISESQESEASVAKTDPQSGNIAVKISDGKMVLSTRALPLYGESGSCVVTLPEGDYSVTYNMASGYLAVDTDIGKLYLQTDDDANYTDDLYLLQGDNGETVIAGAVCCDDSAVFVLAEPASENDIENMMEFTRTTISTISPYSGQTVLSIEDLAVNTNWMKTITITESFVSFGNGEESITMSPYLKSLEGTGIVNKATIADSKTFLYGSYKDANTGLRPFMYNCENGTLKVMSTSEEVLNSAFVVSE